MSVFINRKRLIFFCRPVSILLFLAWMLIAAGTVQEAFAEKKKVTGSIKATTVIGRHQIQCFTDDNAIPAGDLRNRVGAYKSDDPDWNNTTFYIVSFVGPKTNIVYGVDTHPGGDQTFRQLKGATTMESFGTITVTNEGFFVGGTGKFKGIVGTWHTITKATSTEQAGRKTEWVAEYELAE